MAAAVVAESGVFAPEMLAIRYQLNLMELARKLKTRREPRGNPAPINHTTSGEISFACFAKS
jgi:hypothetical protein